MKRLKTLYWKLLGLVILMAMVWLIPPHVRFLQHLGFANVAPRFALLLGLILLVVLGIIIWQQLKIKKLSGKTLNIETHELKVILKILQENFNTAIRFLKKYTRDVKTKNLPWFLVIGPEQSGKTSLLAHSNTHLVSVDNVPLKEVNRTHYCDWWFNKNSVFLDLAGKLTLKSQENSNPYFIWLEFLRFFKKRNYYQNIKGIIVAFDLNQFQKQEREQQLAQLNTLRHHLQASSQLINPLPVYLILTKFDLIAGFNDFFDQLSPEERQQRFGITLPNTQSDQNFLIAFNQQFDHLLKRLNDQIIMRLHQCHNIAKRERIKEFPLQIECQRGLIEMMAGQLNSITTPLHGIYFTSSLQEGKSFDYLGSPLEQALNLKPGSSITTVQAPDKKGFFIAQIFDKLLDTPTAISYHTQNRYHKFYIALGSLAIILGLVWTLNFAKMFSAIHSLRDHELIQLETFNSQSNYVAQLNLLNSARAKANTLFKLSLLTFPASANLQSHLNQIYQQQLERQFAPQLQSILETQLHTTLTNNPEQLFDTLKVYLMLGRMNAKDKTTIMNWFSHYWQKNFPNDKPLQAQLNEHLKNLLAQSFTVQLNSTIISNARATLSKLGLAQLTYLLLEEKYPKTSLQLSSHNSIFSNPAIYMSNLYLAKNFDEIYNTVIPSLCQQMNTKNWVLGTEITNQMSAASVNQLIAAVRQLYIQNYISAWQMQLAAIQLKKLNTLQSAILVSSALSSANSPLKTVFQLFETNLTPIKNQPEFAKIASTQLNELNTLINYTQNHDMQKMVMSLANYLTAIINSSDVDQAAFNAASLRMATNGQSDAISNLINFAQQAPAPFNHILLQLSTNSWQLILFATKDYVNRIWQQQVYKPYAALIDKRYPLNSNTDKEITIEDFTDFFGPSGIMASFFNNYLQPFVDTSQLYWTWRTVDNAHLDIAQSSLEMFIRAALIRKMFFPNDAQKISVQFRLTPIALELSASNFIFRLGTQKIDFLNRNKQKNLITWPAPNNQTASIEFIGKDGQSNKVIKTGAWALLKLIDDADLQTSPNSKIYRLTFNLEGNFAKFELIANYFINPFIPGILHQFRCPPKL